MHRFIIAAVAALLLAGCNTTTNGGEQQPATGSPVASTTAAFPSPEEIALGTSFKPNEGESVVAGYPRLVRAGRNPNCGYIPSVQGSIQSLELPGRIALFVDLSGSGGCNPIGGAAGTTPFVVTTLTRLPDGSVVGINNRGACIIRPNGNNGCR